MMGVDPRRFGPYATRGYLKTKNEEAYANVFTPHYPDEERSAARPLKRTPVYDRMKDLGAVFGSVYGWERPGWFAPKDYALTKEELKSPDVLTNHNYAPPTDDGRIVEKWSFRRSNYFKFVGDECLNVMNNVAVQDMSAFAKMEVSGPGARDWLESILANKIPKKMGRVALCHMLTPRGGVRAEFTVYEWAPGRFYLVSAGAYERHDHDYLRKLAPTDGSVRLNAITTRFGVLVLAGPNSRKVLQKLTDADLSNEAFPWLSGKEISVGTTTAHALRVNFVGELGWEFHHPIEQQIALFDHLMEAGKEFGIRPYGIKAMGALSIEKSYRLVPRELSIEYSAYESGLDRFVHPNKGQFIGRDALVEAKAKGLNWNFVTMEVHGVTDGDSDARGSEPLYAKGTLIGRATNGGFGFRVNKSLALGMVKPEFSALGTELEIKILGKLFKATVIPESPYDPDNKALRVVSLLVPLSFAGQTVSLRRYRNFDMVPAICVGGFVTFLLAGAMGYVFGGHSGGGFQVTLPQMLLLALMGPLQLSIPLIWYAKGAKAVPTASDIDAGRDARRGAEPPLELARRGRSPDEIRFHRRRHHRGGRRDLHLRRPVVWPKGGCRVR
jgi:dimethylglycine dehydrogenase